MENFKQVAEDCLAGKLSGTFFLRNGGSWKSNTLRRYSIEGKIIPGYYVLGKDVILDSNGLNMEIKERVQNFIPDNKKEQITIDIPEGMEAVQEIVNGEIRIKFVDKKVTLRDIPDSISNFCNAYHYKHDENTSRFYKKVEAFRKLTNIRNYFGKPTNNTGYIITPFGTSEVASGYLYLPVFDTREHAQAAIDMLGDELKYLFEPW